MNNLFFEASRISLQPQKRRDQRGDFFEWKMERAQKQLLAALRRDAARRWKAREGGQQKETVRMGGNDPRRSGPLFTF